MYQGLRYANDLFWYKVVYYKRCTALTPDPVNETSCLPYNNIVYNWHINTYLVNNGWTECYDEAFNEYSGTYQLNIACPTGDDIYIFMGAMPNRYSTFSYMGAYGPSRIISDHTHSIEVADIPLDLQGTGYNVYWYNYYEQAIGFSSSEDISLNFVYGGDTEDSSTGLTIDERLSYSLEPTRGGHRVGLYTQLWGNSDFRKIIYYKQCPDETASIEPQTLDGNCVMNDVVHDWHLESNLINKGWTQCYFAPYSAVTRNVSALGCPQG